MNFFKSYSYKNHLSNNNMQQDKDIEDFVKIEAEPIEAEPTVAGSVEVNDIPKTDEKGVTDVIVILDESGSMGSLGDEPRQGINSFCEKQKEAGEFNVTIVTFNTEVTTHYDRVDSKEFTGLEKFNPNGMTALHDAICLTINNFKEKNEKSGKVIVLIVTDGEENSSREYNRHSTKDLITKMEQKGWLFVYLGANQDSITVAKNIGIQHSGNYRYDKAGCAEMFNEVSDQLYRCISGDVPLRAFKSEEMRANLDKLNQPLPPQLPPMFNFQNVHMDAPSLKPTISVSPSFLERS